MVESEPKVLKISSTRPVVAEADTVRINAMGTSSDGNLSKLLRGAMKLVIKSNAPEARNIPTATINPIRVGIIFKTILKPSAVL